MLVFGRPCHGKSRNKKKHGLNAGLVRWENQETRFFNGGFSSKPCLTEGKILCFNICSDWQVADQQIIRRVKRNTFSAWGHFFVRLVHISPVNQHRNVENPPFWDHSLKESRGFSMYEFSATACPPWPPRTSRCQGIKSRHPKSRVVTNHFDHQQPTQAVHKGKKLTSAGSAGFRMFPETADFSHLWF